MRLAFSPAAHAQTTLVYSECGTAPVVRTVSGYSVDSKVPGDLIGPGFALGSVAVSTPAALARVNGEGGIAVDKINKLVYTTNGDKLGGGIGNLTLTVRPLNGSNCSPGAATTTLTVTGTYPFTHNVTGIAIEYWTSPTTGLDEPYRMWCTAGFDDPSMNQSFGWYSYFWLTPCPPNPSTESQGAWTTLMGQQPTGSTRNVRDIAIGIVEVQQNGAWSGAREVCIFGIEGGPLARQSVAVWSVNNASINYVNAASPFTNTLGVAIDTSMPIDLGNSANPPYNPAWGPPRRIEVWSEVVF